MRLPRRIRIAARAAAAAAYVLGAGELGHARATARRPGVLLPAPRPGTLRPARLLRWQVDAALFPDLTHATVLASMRVDGFEMEFPVAHIEALDRDRT